MLARKLLLSLPESKLESQVTTKSNMKGDCTSYPRLLELLCRQKREIILEHSGVNYFSYKGKKLSDLRNETEQKRSIYEIRKFISYNAIHAFKVRFQLRCFYSFSEELESSSGINQSFILRRNSCSFEGTLSFLKFILFNLSR